MKTVILLRHGKSDWDADYVGDHRRPLAGRGQKASIKVGKFLARTNQLPGLVLCSTALRTRETLELAMDAGEWTDVDVKYDNTIYHAGYDQMLRCLAALPDEVDRVMVVGHEPTASLLAGQLIGGASLNFPTAAVARIDLNLEHWKSCRSGVGTLIWLISPRLLKKGIKISKKI
ncbi:MAG: histidine phosphatase family protein [Rhodothermia bacterium]|nr:MAG: histidine phosphatase family protein [Rhodothermia bacterium]